MSSSLRNQLESKRLRADIESYITIGSELATDNERLRAINAELRESEVKLTDMLAALHAINAELRRRNDALHLVNVELVAALEEVRRRVKDLGPWDDIDFIHAAIAKAKT